MFQDSCKFTRKNYHHKNHAESIYWNGIAGSSINIYPGSMDQSNNYEHFLSKNQWFIITVVTNLKTEVSIQQQTYLIKSVIILIIND